MPRLNLKSKCIFGNEKNLPDKLLKIFKLTYWPAQCPSLKLSKVFWTLSTFNPKQCIFIPAPVYDVRTISLYKLNFILHLSLVKAINKKVSGEQISAKRTDNYKKHKHFFCTLKVFILCHFLFTCCSTRRCPWNLMDMSSS